jgi:hypothetical protein
LNDLYALDPSNLEWTLLGANFSIGTPPSPRDSFGITSTGGNLYVFGGEGFVGANTGVPSIFRTARTATHCIGSGSVSVLQRIVPVRHNLLSLVRPKLQRQRNSTIHKDELWLHLNREQTLRHWRLEWRWFVRSRFDFAIIVPCVRRADMSFAAVAGSRSLYGPRYATGGAEKSRASFHLTPYSQVHCPTCTNSTLSAASGQS